MKTRVLFVVNTLQYGGLEKHVLALVRRLDSSRLECTILCLGPDFYSQRLSDQPNVRVIQRNERSVETFFSYWSVFPKLQPQIIIFVKGHVDSYPVIVYFAARLLGAPRLLTMEQLLADPVPAKAKGGGVQNFLRRFVGWRARYVVRHVWPKRLAGAMIDKTICISNAVRDRLVHEYGLPARKMVTIPNGVDLTYFDSMNGINARSIKERLNLDHRDTVIVCVSRLDRRKRIDVLLEAFSIVLKDHPSCKCVIVGTGPEEAKLHATARNLGIAASVTFAGFAEDVRPYLERSDIYVSSSIQEGLGVSIVEAMACRLPCVVTNISGHTEVVVHELNGLLVAPESPKDLADAIKYLVVHKEERARMGINGRRRVEELFDINNSVVKMKAVLFGQL